MKTNYYIAGTLLLLILFKMNGLAILNEYYIFSFSLATFLMTLSSFIDFSNNNLFIMWGKKDLQNFNFKLVNILNFLGTFVFIALPMMLPSIVSRTSNNFILSTFNEYITITSMSLILISIAFNDKIISNRQEILDAKKMLTVLKEEISNHKKRIKEQEEIIDKTIKENEFKMKVIDDERNYYSAKNKELDDKINILLDKYNSQNEEFTK